jgi:hypothetical protein
MRLMMSQPERLRIRLWHGCGMDLKLTDDQRSAIIADIQRFVETTAKRP